MGAVEARSKGKMSSEKKEQDEMKKLKDSGKKERTSIRKKWKDVTDPDWRFSIVKAIQEAKSRYRKGWKRTDHVYKFKFVQEETGIKHKVICEETQPFSSVIGKYCTNSGLSREEITFWADKEEIRGILEEYTPLELGYEYPMKDFEIQVRKRK